jgi:hypothetical protein
VPVKPEGKHREQKEPERGINVRLEKAIFVNGVEHDGLPDLGLSPRWGQIPELRGRESASL